MSDASAACLTAFGIQNEPCSSIGLSARMSYLAFGCGPFAPAGAGALLVAALPEPVPALPLVAWLLPVVALPASPMVGLFEPLVGSAFGTDSAAFAGVGATALPPGARAKALVLLFCSWWSVWSCFFVLFL